jgi:hypothetical protein
MNVASKYPTRGNFRPDRLNCPLWKLGIGSWELTKAAALVCGLIICVACHDLQVVTNSYATLAEAQKSGAVERGWMPDLLPPGAHDIREAHDQARSRRRWGLFSFRPDDEGTLKARLGPEISFDGAGTDAPPRIEWWPVLLRGTLDHTQLAATGLKGYAVPGGELVVAVNWNQRRAYYWSRR